MDPRRYRDGSEFRATAERNQRISDRASEVVDFSIEDLPTPALVSSVIALSDLASVYKQQRDELQSNLDDCACELAIDKREIDSLNGKIRKLQKQLREAKKNQLVKEESTDAS